MKAQTIAPRRAIRAEFERINEFVGAKIKGCRIENYIVNETIDMFQFGLIFPAYGGKEIKRCFPDLQTLEAYFLKTL
jgi:hypothetical protein